MAKKEPVCRERVAAYFSGYVQGVGFRYTAVSQARYFNVQGYAKNLPDGRVELVAEGDPRELVHFVEKMKSVFGRFVRDTQFTFESATGEFDGFGIRH